MGVRMLMMVALSLQLEGAQVPPPAQDSPHPQEPPLRIEKTIEVVGATPIHGLGIDRDRIPGNVQTVTAGASDPAGGTSVAEQLNTAASSIHLNDATTNPFQPDLQFRGFVGSPLLGLPQGLAVYQNGVRLNEPFGDTVNWDLLPANAVATINLMPGSNPLFGLNALGGAVSIQTKTGFSHPRHAVNVSGGSFGRRLIEGESGGHRGGVSYFVAGSALTEAGWRDFSPSRLRQLFGDVEWRKASTTLNATVTSGRNRLTGNGAAPVALLAQDRSAIFTHPDDTRTGVTLVTFRARHTAGTAVTFDGMIAYRRASIRLVNGDDSDYDACEHGEFDGLLCSDEGAGPPVEDQFAAFVPVGEDGELNATTNTSNTLMDGWAGALQATVVKPLANRANHFVAGATLDGGVASYAADTEIARLTGDRGTTGTGLFDQAAVVRLRTRVQHNGLYAADFFTVAPRLTVMAAARFNHSTVRLQDRSGTALNGEHRFSRLNPAAGVTYELPQDLTVYGSFSMSSRVPAPSELSCADPDDPCRLPNAFVADPPLAQVAARTWEGGIRSRRRALAWNASVFRTANTDDIMFISSGPRTNTGHFENVGETLRQGIEIGAWGAPGALRWGAGYSFLRARFNSPLTLSSPHHPAGEDGEILVASGSRLPTIPQHNLKVHASAAIERLTIGGTLLSTSNQYLRGDEANLLPAIRGFVVVNLTATCAITKQVALTGRVTNLLGSEHATFGLLGNAEDVLGPGYEDPRFLSPGAPRAGWVGVVFSVR